MATEAEAKAAAAVAFLEVELLIDLPAELAAPFLATVLRADPALRVLEAEVGKPDRYVLLSKANHKMYICKSQKRTQMAVMSVIV